MKRLSIFIILLLFPVLVLAKNKMSMVTYFPVPYVAYSQVNADKQLDIGLTSTCDMNLGCNESNINLKANQVNLTGGKLELNGGKGISGQTMTVGTGSGAGTISFTNIRIQGGNMESLNAGSMNVKELHLFGKKFPSCKGANGSGQMKWASLQLKGAEKEELYLMCGNAQPGASSPCCTSDELSKGKKCNTATNKCECPSGYTESPSGYCNPACTPSANYREMSEAEVEQNMAHKTPCNSSWRENPYKYTCRQGETRYCPDAYKTGIKTEFIHKEVNQNIISNSSTQCHGNIPSDSISWQYKSYDGKQVSGWERIEKTSYVDCSRYTSYGTGLVGIISCEEQGYNNYRWTLRGYCNYTYKYMYADVVCCP